MGPYVNQCGRLDMEFLNNEANIQHSWDIYR